MFGRKSSILIRWVIFLVAIKFSAGCVNPRFSSDSTLDFALCDLPEFALSQLSEAEYSEVRRFALTVSIPTDAESGELDDLSSLFDFWYQKGYAYSFITGAISKPTHADYSVCSIEDRVKNIAWQRGLVDGGDAKLRSDFYEMFGPNR